MPSEMTAMPKKLKMGGYATHMVGKWHVRHPPKPHDLISTDVFSETLLAHRLACSPSARPPSGAGLTLPSTTLTVRRITGPRQPAAGKYCIGTCSTYSCMQSKTATTTAIHSMQATSGNFRGKFAFLHHERCVLCDQRCLQLPLHGRITPRAGTN